jgi:hypothetical protein
MKMLYPKDIEYCINVMAGSEQPPKTPKGRNTGIGMYIKLARYDVNFVNNVSSYLHRDMGMTSRQRELALKLTDKYRKQFRLLGIDVSKIVQKPVFSSEVRTVDRSKRFDIQGEFIHLYFPYNQELIKTINQMLREDDLIHNKESEWNAESKRWNINFTEHNFVLLYKWATEHGFKFSDSVKDIWNRFEKIIQDKNKYNIHATDNGDTLKLHNAPKDLQDYWDSNVKDKKIIEQIKNCGLLAIDLDKSVLTKYNFSNTEQEILTNGFLSLDKPISEVLFTCLDLGFEKIAVGLTSHSASNVDQVNKIVKWYKVKYGDTSDVVINSKNNVFGDLKVASEPTDKTRLIITDRMSRLQNKHWDFKADVTIGHGMYNKRNIFQGSKIIDVKPSKEEDGWQVDSDEIF